MPVLFANSAPIQYARVWLNVIPSSSLKLYLPDLDFRPTLLPLSPDLSLCLVCSRPVDPFEDSQIRCGGSSSHIFYHNSLQDILFAAAYSAALGPRKRFLTSSLPHAPTLLTFSCQTGGEESQRPSMFRSFPRNNGRCCIPACSRLAFAKGLQLYNLPTCQGSGQYRFHFTYYRVPGWVRK